MTDEERNLEIGVLRAAIKKLRTMLSKPNNPETIEEIEQSIEDFEERLGQLLSMN